MRPARVLQVLQPGNECFVVFGGIGELALGTCGEEWQSTLTLEMSMPIVCGSLSLIFSAAACLSSGPRSPGIRSGLKEKKGAIRL